MVVLIDDITQGQRSHPRLPRRRSRLRLLFGVGEDGTPARV